MGEALELGEVVDHARAEEGGAVLQRRLVDDHSGTLGLDALHHSLDRRLAEVVTVGLHGQAVDPDNALALGCRPESIGMRVAVPPGHLKHLVGDEVLARAVALHDGRHHALGHVGIVGEQLLGVLGKAVAAVAERGVVVVCADARIEADTLDDGARVEALDLGVGVELVEVAHAQGKVGVGEELHGLGLLHAHEQRGDILLDGPLTEERRECAGRGLESRGIGDALDRFVLSGVGRIVDELGGAHDDARGVEVVVERLGLAKELGREQQVEPLHAPRGVLEVKTTAVANGDGGLDHHHGRGVDRQDKVDDLLHVGGVEVVAHRIVVGRGGYDHEVGVAVGRGSVEGSPQVKVLFGEVTLYILVLDGGAAGVDHVDLPGDDVYGGHTVVLGEQCRYAKPHVACPGYGYAVFLHIIW